MAMRRIIIHMAFKYNFKGLPSQTRSFMSAITFTLVTNSYISHFERFDKRGYKKAKIFHFIKKLKKMRHAHWLVS
jgi:hypothetical protein